MRKDDCIFDTFGTDFGAREGIPPSTATVSMEIVVDPETGELSMADDVLGQGELFVRSHQTDEEVFLKELAEIFLQRLQALKDLGEQILKMDDPRDACRQIQSINAGIQADFLDSFPLS